jgi:hypothetical protein
MPSRRSSASTPIDACGPFTYPLGFLEERLQTISDFFAGWRQGRRLACGLGLRFRLFRSLGSRSVARCAFLQIRNPEGSQNNGQDRNDPGILFHDEALGACLGDFRSTTVGPEPLSRRCELGSQFCNHIRFDENRELKPVHCLPLLATSPG